MVKALPSPSLVIKAKFSHSDLGRGELRGFKRYNRVIAKCPPNPPLLTSIPFAMWLCSLSQQEVKPASVSPEVESGLPCDLLWPVELNGSDSVPRLGLKKPCGIPCSLRILLAPCERAWASLQKDGDMSRRAQLSQLRPPYTCLWAATPQKWELILDQQRCLLNL